MKSFDIRKSPLLPIATFALAGGLAITGCSSAAKNAAPNKSMEQPSEGGSDASSVTIVPNMAGFLKNPTTCLNGGIRPCAILIRQNPKLSSSYINALPTDTTVSWPLESYNGQPGDPVKVECYVTNGNEDSVTDGIDLPASTDWYEVAVPEDHVRNTQPSTPYKTITQDGQNYTIGYASVEWFDQSTPQVGIPSCN